MPQKPYPRHREDPTLGPRVKDDAGRGDIASGDKGKTGGETRKSKAHDNDGLTHDAGRCQYAASQAAAVSGQDAHSPASGQHADDHGHQQEAGGEDRHVNGHAQSYLKGAKVAELVVMARTLTASNSCVAAT
jgi:hypothetical protein